MTIATVRSVVKQFIESPIPGVLVLKGPWGVGKTYLWSKQVEALKETAALPNYSYVSLFGISSIAELRLAIFAKMLPVRMVGESITVANVTENWVEYGKRGAKALAH